MSDDGAEVIAHAVTAGVVSEDDGPFVVERASEVLYDWILAHMDEMADGDEILIIRRLGDG